jgi:hypothetical protein
MVLMAVDKAYYSHELWHAGFARVVLSRELVGMATSSKQEVRQLLDPELVYLAHAT